MIQLRYSCVDESGIYKGLIVICKELNLIDSKVQTKDVSLNDLRNILLKHPAFGGEITRLERLASSYGHKVIFCPKFHCELNPVEGCFCDLKQFVRKHNDQDFNKFNSLIMSAFDQFKKKNINIKLWKRFWKALGMYENGSTYQEVLVTLFGSKSSANVETHKKNKNFNTNLKEI